MNQPALPLQSHCHWQREGKLTPATCFEKAVSNHAWQQHFCLPAQVTLWVPIQRQSKTPKHRNTFNGYANLWIKILLYLKALLQDILPKCFPRVTAYTPSTLLLFFKKKKKNLSCTKSRFVQVVSHFNPHTGTLFSSCPGQVTFYKQRFSQPQLLLHHIFPHLVMWAYFGKAFSSLRKGNNCNWLFADLLLANSVPPLLFSCPSKNVDPCYASTLPRPEGRQAFSPSFQLLRQTDIKTTATSTVTEVLQADKMKEK